MRRAWGAKSDLVLRMTDMGQHKEEIWGTLKPGPDR